MWLAQRPCVTYILSHLLLLLFAGRVIGQPDASVSTANNAAATTPDPVVVDSTCEARTVNYITHTLPQQCLTSSPLAFTSPESTTTTAASSSSSVASEPTSTAAEQHDELDADGEDLTTGSFMSFEEWKAMMLEKSGQEALEPKQRKAKDGRGDAYPGDDFASLGDEGEVSFDFDAYSDKISEITSATRPSQKDEGGQVDKVTYDEGLAQAYRSKDAGKTCKERFSYASFDGGATVLKASPGAKNPKAILVENKDSYMLLECAMQNKFFVVELSDDILVDTVVLANFEFFSSMIRQFRVSVSDRYPAKSDKWKILGTFEARNSRDIQPFLVENPQIWAKYIRIEILTHFGNEYYCPVSLFRVHGTRMIDSWKEADPAYLESEDEPGKTGSEGTEGTTEGTESESEEAEVGEPPEPETPALDKDTEQGAWMPYWDESYFSSNFPWDSTCVVGDAEDPASQHEKEDHDQKHTAVKPQPVGTSEQANPSSSEAATTQPASQAATESAKPAPPSNSGVPISSTSVVNSTESTSTPTSSPDSRSGPTSSQSAPTTIAPPSAAKTASAPKGKTTASTSVKPPSSRSAAAPKGQQAAPSGSPTTPRNKTASATASGPPASPTVQDSFFKALQKRLQSLESNTTLSLQYIESQSRFLQDALARLERRQVARVDLFLGSLNRTVLGELRDVRELYGQLWQSTIIALESQRDQSERQIVALSSRLGVLADEVVFQKRMAIVQSLLLLGCLVLVVFSRPGFGPAAPYQNTANNFVANTTGAAAHFLGPGGPFSTPSPVYPSTPKARHRPAHSPPDDYDDDTVAATSNDFLSVDDANSPAHGSLHRLRRDRSPSQTPDSASSSSPSALLRRRRPSPGRSATDPAANAAVDYFRASTPLSSSLDAGYDSEPAMTPAATTTPAAGVAAAAPATTIPRAAGGQHGVDAAAAAKGGVPLSSYPETLARRSERQLTPSSDTDGVEYISLPTRPSLTHSTSARKPLPALPEDPD
ncbi:hypothetical protein GGR52DRAFT_530385 [Hypoxylon sp. FL1284]|nr:hypothetical protein GGR52DRAFT_530385 [Hypoxylon sp. FL1284]